MPAAECLPLSPPYARSRRWSAWAELLVLPALLPLAAAAVGSAAAAKYAQWWGTARGWQAMGRTVQLASLAALIALVLAWALAAAAVRGSRRLAVPVALVSCLPMLIPSSALATAWIVAMGPTGPFGPVLDRLGLSVYSLPAAAVVLALRYFGIAAAILMHQQLRQLSHWPVERAFRVRLLARAVHLRLQGSLRATAVAALIVMLFCMNDHIIPGMLLISTYGPQVMIQYSALLDPAGAAALAMPMAGVCAVMVVLALTIGRGGWIRTDGLPGECGPARALPQRIAAGALTAVVLAAALAAPIVVLARQAGSVSAVGEVLWEARRQLWQTLYCVAVASPICAAMAAVLARRWVQCRQAGRLTAVPLVLLNLTVPATLLGIGLIGLTGGRLLTGLRDSSWPLIAAYVARFMPLATLAFYVAWRNDSDLPNAAARVHGVGAWTAAVRLAWPRRRTVLLAVAVLCGVLIVTELEISILLAAPGASTLGIRLYTLIHTAPDRIVSALTLGIAALTLPGIVLLALLLWRTRSRPGGAA